MMLTVLETDDLASARTDFLSVLCFEDTMAESPVLARLDAGLGGLLRQLAGEEEFQGKKGQSLLLHTHGRLGASRVQLLGGGARKDFQPADLRLFAAKAARGGNGAHARTVT